MKINLTGLFILIILTNSIPVFSQELETHPRLLISATRVRQIKAAIQKSGSHHQEAFNALKKRVEKDDFRYFGATGDNWNYSRAYLAQSAAFLYQITGENKYAIIAFKTVQAIFNDPDPDRRLPYSENYGDKKVDLNYGLSRATVGLGLAYAYDWCYNGWTTEQRNYVRAHLIRALDSWETYKHANLESPHKSSNWVAVCRGGELVMQLAVYGDKSRPARFALLKQDLSLHIKNAYGEAGFTQEGIAYCAYAGQYLLPAVYALQGVGDSTLNPIFYQKQWWRWIMYASSFARNTKGFAYTLQTGVAGNLTDNQGWLSLNLGAVPADKLPYYLHFYNRMHGKSAPVPDSLKYEPGRCGTVWSLLYYPENIKAKNPTKQPDFKALADAHGAAYFFRNRWQDANDIHLSMLADRTEHSHAWDQAEAGQVTLNGLGHAFFSGPEKFRDAYLFSTLLVNQKNTPDQKGNNSLTGEVINFIPDKKGGGSVIVGGGLKYKALGLQNTERRLTALFSSKKVPVILSLTDIVQSEKVNDYTLNFNLGREEKFSIKTDLVENNMPVFLIQAKDEVYLKGWVIQGEDIKIKSQQILTEDLKEKNNPFTTLQINTRGDNSTVQVIMVIGRGKPVAARLIKQNAGNYWKLYRTKIKLEK